MLSPGLGVSRDCPTQPPADGTARLPPAAATAATTAAAAPLSGRRLLVPGVIVVGAEEHVGVLQLRIGARDDADDVARQAGLDDIVGRVDLDGELHVLQRRRRQRLARIGLRLDVRVVEPRRAEDEGEEVVPRGDLGRDLVVEPLHGLEVAEVRVRAAAPGPAAGCAAGAAGAPAVVGAAVVGVAVAGSRCGGGSRRSRTRRAGAASGAAAAAEAAARGTDRGHRVLQLDRVPGARAEQAVLRRRQDRRARGRRRRSRSCR